MAEDEKVLCSPLFVHYLCLFERLRVFFQLF